MIEENLRKEPLNKVLERAIKEVNVEKVRALIEDQGVLVDSRILEQLLEKYLLSGVPSQAIGFLLEKGAKFNVSIIEKAVRFNNSREDLMKRNRPVGDPICPINLADSIKEMITKAPESIGSVDSIIYEESSLEEQSLLELVQLCIDNEKIRCDSFAFSMSIKKSAPDSVIKLLSKQEGVLQHSQDNINTALEKNRSAYVLNLLMKPKEQKNINNFDKHEWLRGLLKKAIDNKCSFEVIKTLIDKLKEKEEELKEKEEELKEKIGYNDADVEDCIQKRKNLLGQAAHIGVSSLDVLRELMKDVDETILTNALSRLVNSSNKKFYTESQEEVFDLLLEKGARLDIGNASIRNGFYQKMFIQAEKLANLLEANELASDDESEEKVSRYLQRLKLMVIKIGIKSEDDIKKREQELEEREQELEEREQELEERKQELSYNLVLNVPREIKSQEKVIKSLLLCGVDPNFVSDGQLYNGLRQSVDELIKGWKNIQQQTITQNATVLHALYQGDKTGGAPFVNLPSDMVNEISGFLGKGRGLSTDDISDAANQGFEKVDKTLKLFSLLSDLSKIIDDKPKSKNLIDDFLKELSKQNSRKIADEPRSENWIDDCLEELPTTNHNNKDIEKRALVKALRFCMIDFQKGIINNEVFKNILLSGAEIVGLLDKMKDGEEESKGEPKNDYQDVSPGSYENALKRFDNLLRSMQNSIDGTELRIACQTYVQEDRCSAIFKYTQGNGYEIKPHKVDLPDMSIHQIQYSADNFKWERLSFDLTQEEALKIYSNIRDFLLNPSSLRYLAHIDTELGSRMQKKINDKPKDELKEDELKKNRPDYVIAGKGCFIPGPPPSDAVLYKYDGLLNYLLLEEEKKRGVNVEGYTPRFAEFIEQDVANKFVADGHTFSEDMKRNGFIFHGKYSHRLQLLTIMKACEEGALDLNIEEGSNRRNLTQKELLELFTTVHIESPSGAKVSLWGMLLDSSFDNVYFAASQQEDEEKIDPNQYYDPAKQLFSIRSPDIINSILMCFDNVLDLENLGSYLRNSHYKVAAQMCQQAQDLMPSIQTKTFADLYTPCMIFQSSDGLHVSITANSVISPLTDSTHSDKYEPVTKKDDKGKDVVIHKNIRKKIVAESNNRTHIIAEFPDEYIKRKREESIERKREESSNSRDFIEVIPHEIVSEGNTLTVTCLDDDAISEVIAALDENITELVIDKSFIGNKGCKALADGLKNNRSLQKLSLKKSRYMGADGLSYLLKALKEGENQINSLEIVGGSFYFPEQAAQDLVNNEKITTFSMTEDEKILIVGRDMKTITNKENFVTSLTPCKEIAEKLHEEYTGRQTRKLTEKEIELIAETKKMSTLDQRDYYGYYSELYGEIDPEHKEPMFAIRCLSYLFFIMGEPLEYIDFSNVKEDGPLDILLKAIARNISDTLCEHIMPEKVEKNIHDRKPQDDKTQQDDKASPKTSVKRPSSPIDPDSQINWRN